jgi:hypothetical protein
MSVGASRRAGEGAPTQTGLDGLMDALRAYPDIRPKRNGGILHLFGPCPARYLVWDAEKDAAAWYAGPDHGTHLDPNVVKAAEQIAVVMGSVHA